MVWIGDRAPEDVVHELLWQSQGLCGWLAGASVEPRDAGWGSRGALRARSQSHACARARSPIPLAIGRGETIADIVQREFKVCLSVCLSVFKVCVCLSISITGACRPLLSARPPGARRGERQHAERCGQNHGAVECMCCAHPRLLCSARSRGRRARAGPTEEHRHLAERAMARLSCCCGGGRVCG